METVWIVAFVVTAVVFLAADVAGLKYLIRPVFENSIGGMLLDRPKLGAALVFYLFYVAGVVWFVLVPALDEGWPLNSVFLQAGLLGALAYGTYEFTNFATLRNWSWRMVAADLAWGTFLTGASATCGYAVAGAFTQVP